jgi:hypothetical protein
MSRNNTMLTTAVQEYTLAAFETYQSLATQKHDVKKLPLTRMPNWTEAYCISMLSVVYLKIPTRKTGTTNRAFRFENAPRSRFKERSDISWTEFPPSSSFGTCWSLIDRRKFGMRRSNSKHSTIAPIAKPQGIQGEISIVTEAIHDPASSAT